MPALINLSARVNALDKSPCNPANCPVLISDFVISTNAAYGANLLLTAALILVISFKLKPCPVPKYLFKFSLKNLLNYLKVPTSLPIDLSTSSTAI